MTDAPPSPQINVSKMPVGSGIAGSLFTLGSMAIFLVGIPALRYFLGATAALGLGVALLIRRRGEPCSTRRILSEPIKR
ncbi:MAG TPA: hypothetical protein VMU19_13075 [Bryobacteraceae bacterium]|nr:hypothetical protein [Bryobacteraceae bacterium]